MRNSLNSLVHRMVAENFLNRKPHFHVKALLLRLADQKLQGERAVRIAASTRLQHDDVALFKRRRNVIREQQIRQQPRLVDGKSERKNPTMIELRNFLNIVNQLKARMLLKCEPDNL